MEIKWKSALLKANQKSFQVWLVKVFDILQLQLEEVELQMASDIASDWQSVHFLNIFHPSCRIEYAGFFHHFSYNFLVCNPVPLWGLVIYTPFHITQLWKVAKLHRVWTYTWSCLPLENIHFELRPFLQIKWSPDPQKSCHWTESCKILDSRFRFSR